MAQDNNRNGKLKEFFAPGGPYYRFMDILGGMIWVGLLWLLTSLLVILGLPAAMAAYHTMTEAVRKHKNYVTKEYFQSYIGYFKRWTAAWLADLFILLWLIFDGVYLYGYGTEFAQALSYIIYGLILLYTAVNVIFLPYASMCCDDENSRFEVFKTAFYITFRHMGRTLCCVLLLIAVVLLIYLIPVGIMIFPGLYWYLASLILDPVFTLYIPEYGEEEEEGDRQVKRSGQKG